MILPRHKSSFIFNLVLKLKLVVILLSLVSLIRCQISFDVSSEGDLAFVRVRILDILGSDEHNKIRVFGRRANVTDSLGVNHAIVTFKGLPFAVPPVKSLRFQRPTLKLLTEDFQALEEPPPCPQLTAQGQFIGNEDCLQLNIFMPELENSFNQKIKMPVLIWFHGEGKDRNQEGIFETFASGSAKDINPEVFIFKNIVVVTPQYRLGSLGFLQTVNEDLNGNMGLFDQMQAIEWVQRYIGDFGGDSKQITVMGQGSSAIGLGLLATSDLARGLFQRLILMGGSPLSPIALDSTPKLTFAEIALQNSCPSFPSSQFVRCMQERKLQNLLLSDQRLIKGKHFGRMKMPLPIIQKEADGRFLPPLVFRHPSSTLSTGNFEPVPLIIGVSSYEMSGYLPSLAGKQNMDEIDKTIFSSPEILKHFLRSILSRNFADPDLVSDIFAFEYFSGLNITLRQDQAKDLLEEMLSDLLYFIPALSMAKMWSKFGPVYLYVFDYATSLTNPEDNGFNGILESQNQGQFIQANHGSDLQFLMGGHKGSSQDREISGVLVDLWTNFIYKGSPLNSGVEWPQYRPETKEFLLISDDMSVESGFRRRQEHLWSDLVPSINTRICSRSTGRGRAGSASSASLVYSRRGPPLLYKDVDELDISKQFFTFGTNKSNA